MTIEEECWNPKFITILFMFYDSIFIYDVFKYADLFTEIKPVAPPYSVKIWVCYFSTKFV